MTRSKFLVHWTGKGIHTDVKTLTDPHRSAYADRLVDILSNGFWMTTPPEKLVGGHARSNLGGQVSFTYKASMTCFTEARLSAASVLASAFGLLGIAVDRHFVLDRWGGPVHYVRNHADEHIVASLFDLRYLLKTRLAFLGTDASDALHDAEYLGVFLKAMSTAGTDDFSMIDEHEWRVVQTTAQTDGGHIVATGFANPLFKLKLSHSDVKLLVLPDDATRTLVLNDPRFQTALWACGSHPPILTLDDCASL
jgi:hypothetical protein